VWGKWTQITTFSLRLHLLERDQFHVSAALTPDNSDRCSLDTRQGGPQSQSERYGEMKILDPTGARSSSVVQPVASRYTDWAAANVLVTVFVLYLYCVF
jgi:hypothetical protein